MAETRAFNQLFKLGRVLSDGIIVQALCAVLVGIVESVVRVGHWIKWGDSWGIEDTYTIDNETGPFHNGDLVFEHEITGRADITD